MRKHLRPYAVAVLVSLIPTLVPCAALAQGAAAADPTIQAARARFSEGVEFYDKGQYENARASFLQAYALHKHPAVLLNLAQSSLRSGHMLDADRYFTRYMHDSPSLTPAQRAEAEKGLLEARGKLGRIDITAPAGAAVTIDGEPAGTDGSSLTDVEPGTHTVKAGVESSSVTVSAGQTVTVKLGKAAPAVVAPTPEPTPTPVAPTTDAPPADATPAAAATTTSSGPGLFSPPDNMIPVWIGAGVGVAGLATAIAFGIFKGNAQSSYDGEVSAIKSALGSNAQGACINPTNAQIIAGCSALNSDGNAVNTDATVANVGIAAGVIGFGFAAGWYLFAPKADTKAPAKTAWPRVEPIVGPRFNGMSVGGSF